MNSAWHIDKCLVNSGLQSFDVKWKWKSLSHVQIFVPHGLYSPWNSPGQNTGMGSLPLLQEIFPTQGSNLGLPHCRRILYQLSYKGSPSTLEWVAYPVSSGSSWPRNQTRVSCIAGGFFTNLDSREAPDIRKAAIWIHFKNVNEINQTQRNTYWVFLFI